MLVVNVSIVEFFKEGQPNFVKARLTDASGINWFFVDKCLILTADSLDESNPYPLPGVIACRIVKREHNTQGREIVTIDTEEPWHVAAVAGETQFSVFAHQLSGADTLDQH